MGVLVRHPTESGNAPRNKTVTNLTFFFTYTHSYALLSCGQITMLPTDNCVITTGPRAPVSQTPARSDGYSFCHIYVIHQSPQIMRQPHSPQALQLPVSSPLRVSP